MKPVFRNALKRLCTLAEIPNTLSVHGSNVGHMIPVPPFQTSMDTLRQCFHAHLRVFEQTQATPLLSLTSSPLGGVVNCLRDANSEAPETKRHAKSEYFQLCGFVNENKCIGDCVSFRLLSIKRTARVLEQTAAL